MTEILWPMIRNFLVIGILLSAMWHPKKRRTHKHNDDTDKNNDVKGDWIDAEYETID